MNRAQFYKKYEAPLRLDDRGGGVKDRNESYVSPQAMLEYIQWLEEEQDGLIKAYCNSATLLARFIET